MDTTRAAWLKERLNGLGGTDVANIMLSSAEKSQKSGSFSKSLFTLWSEKMKLAKKEESDNAVFRRGRVMEKYVCEMYQERMGGDVELFESGLTWHSTRKRIFGTPDMLVRRGDEAWGMDAKTRRSARGWGEDGSEDVPLDVEVQMRTYMEVFDTPYWDVATLFHLDDFRVYRLHRDRELGENILSMAEEWWVKHVDGETPPSADGSESAKQVLAQMHPRVTEKELRAPTGVELELYKDLLVVRAKHKEFEERKKQLENELRRLIGDSVGIKGIATWKETKARTRFDTKRFKEEQPDVYETYTLETPGPRMLRILEKQHE
jgi:predicted phage-related endonuclease